MGTVMIYNTAFKGNASGLFAHAPCADRLEGCSRGAMERAARNGHLEVVKLLHDIGATCTSTAVHLAQVHGHHGVYRFLNAMYPGKVIWVESWELDKVLLSQV